MELVDAVFGDDFSVHLRVHQIVGVDVDDVAVYPNFRFSGEAEADLGFQEFEDKRNPTLRRDDKGIQNAIIRLDFFAEIPSMTKVGGVEDNAKIGPACLKLMDFRRFPLDLNLFPHEVHDIRQRFGSFSVECLFGAAKTGVVHKNPFMGFCFQQSRIQISQLMFPLSQKPHPFFPASDPQFSCHIITCSSRNKHQRDAI